MQVLKKEILHQGLLVHKCDNIQFRTWEGRNSNIIDCSVPLLLTWIDLNPPRISNKRPIKVLDEINYPFPILNDCTVEVWEWMNNFISHFIMDVLSDPCWD